MPKIKTNRSAHKRVLKLLKGKKSKKNKSKIFVASQSGKQHNMTKRAQSTIRNLRGTTVLCKAASNMLAKLLPYAKKYK